MAVDVRPVVLIRRPRHEVAAFMFDPHNDLRWTGGITASRPAQPGPLVAGASVERTARFLGRSFTYGYVVTEHQPDHLVELKVDRRLGEPEPGPVGGHVAVGGPEGALPVGARQDVADAGGIGVDIDGEGDGSAHDILQDLDTRTVASSF